MAGVRFERLDKVRIGLIGAGGRGQSLLHDFLGVEGVEVTALCDIVPDRVRESQARLRRVGKPTAAEYTRGERDYERLVVRDDIDLVLVATPWDWHVPMSVSAMKAGKHVGVEVPAAVTIDECWELVDTSEATRKHCVILENCCYGFSELLVLQMVRKGLLGEITHGEAAYIHDLRGLLLADSGEGLWRREPHISRDGNLYPTHGLGPIANCMSVNRGDRFQSMVSMSSMERSLTVYRDKNLKADDPKRKEKYRCGDMNTSILRTERGRTIMLQHDVVTPRPYSRINMVCGTGGTFADYPARIHIDGKPEEWEKIDGYRAEYEHPLWKRIGEIARKVGGHGGMDFVMAYRLIECMRAGIEPDMDVYDAAAWSAPGPLSDLSVKRGGAAVKFPDFTRGAWKKERLPYT
jgi:hypothetical protein